MDTTEPVNVPRLVTILGLSAGGVGILVLFSAGVEFPFTLLLPPGVWVLLGIICVVALVPRRWAAVLGAFGGLFVTVGFVVSGSVPHLWGSDGSAVMVGSWIQLLGVVTALVAGAVATRAGEQRAVLSLESRGKVAGGQDR